MIVLWLIVIMGPVSGGWLPDRISIGALPRERRREFPAAVGSYPRSALALRADDADTPFMGGSTADTPTTPESLRVSDADRDHAVNELRNEFVEGRLSHETFVYRMQTALDARNRGQLAKLFTDLPPRRVRLLARIRTALRGARVPVADPGHTGRDRDQAVRYGGGAPVRLRRPADRAAATASPSGGLVTATCAWLTCRCPGGTPSWCAAPAAGCSTTSDPTMSPG